nr:hypothetical protein [Tanacetum cinerariifolium]
MHKAFPLPVTEFPLPEELPTAREDSFHCQKKREATAKKIALLSMSRRNCQSKVEVTLNTTTTDTTSGETGTKSGRTVTLTAEDMQKKKNGVKARTTLLLSLPDEHRLRFSKYKTERELWAAILKTFRGNEATNKTKKNLLKQQHGNFRAEGSETLEQTFSRLQVIVVWRNMSDLDTMSLDDLYNHLKVYESEVQKKTKPNTQNMAFISSAKHSSRNKDGNTACVPTASINVPTASASVATISQDTACAYIASQSSSSQIKFEDINQINEDDMEEMDIKWNMALLSMRANKFTWTFFLKSKDETSGILKKFISEIENLKDLRVKIIRCDNGGEFRNKEMNDFCSQKRIKREFSNARTPQQNGVAKRRNRTLIEAARTMLADVKLPVTFWAEAVNTALVDAGTNSTNFSGTKDAAGQEVKKDVSTLRYIALPNWAHDAFLESSSSKSQDDCNTDVPESKPSIETRLISKRIANQEETSSLDNILTLTNRFEDILGVTTNSKESNGVEADTLVDCPKGVRPIGIKWVLKNKKDERGIIIRNKARLVAQGHTQEEGIDYDEVFVPVARIKAIRLFLAYASFMGFTLYQMNVKSAFLYGTIDEEVYVMQPPGFQDPEYPARVYKVEKTMYGLHQAPRAWYGTLSKYLLTNGFQRGTIDQTLFIRRQRGDFILVQVYVDDIIFGSSNPQLCREFEAFMHEKFQMSVMDVRSSNTPMEKENPWGKDGTGIDVDLHLYRSMIGSLMYLTASRPVIMFDICACDRHQVIPKECQLHTVKRIFRYLKGHPKLGIWYPKDSPFDLVAYSDSDYGGATQDRKSTTGGCQFLGRILISWQCKKQTIIATSTTEA